MRGFAAGPVLLALLAVSPLHGQDSALAAPSLSATEIDEAIALGMKEKSGVGIYAGLAQKGVGGSIRRGTATEGYFVVVQGPFGRVASAAAEHAKKYLPYNRDSVPPGLLAPIVTVAVTPMAPKFSNGRWYTTPDVVHVVLAPGKEKGQSEPPAPVQPLQVEKTSTHYTYGSGLQIDAGGVIAAFDRGSIPSDRFEVVIVTDGKEFRELILKKWLDDLR